MKNAGYEPVLSALENTPNAINDEIRIHLSYDAMVVVDLGGISPQDEPNPNVMYELGIRYALNLPLVIMGWVGQRLPFDISNQRVLLLEREFVTMPDDISQLEDFINSAKEGVFYKPMDAVVRSGILERATDELSSDNLLRVIADEIRDLKEQVYKRRIGVLRGNQRKRAIVSGYLGGKSEKKTLYKKFVEKGGTNEEWGKILNIPIDDEMYETTIGWSITQWRKFVFSKIGEREL